MPSMPSQLKFTQFFQIFYTWYKSLMHCTLKKENEMFALLVQLAPVLAKLRQLRERYDQIDRRRIKITMLLGTRSK